ncbi:MAG TPA: DUF1592 domain-containing protein [Humisphaera sp.]|nr:DUF1592 domain-containing protein [Humisphaera sp.]
MRLQFKNSFAIAAVLSLVSVCFAAVAAAEESTANPSSGDWPQFSKIVQPFLSKYCFDCHDQTAKGDVRLDQFQDEHALIDRLETVEQAANMVRRHAMPPKKREQPEAGQAKEVVAWLDGFVAKMDRKLPANPGRSIVRRLNRAEYNNTVRDLLGVSFRPADDFPPDDSGYGFDNIGAALSMSPALMEKYLAAAEKVARTAVFGVERMQPERVSHEPYFVADAFSKNRTVKFDYDETGLSLPSALHVTQQFPVDGKYKMRTIFRGSRPVGADPVEIAFWIDGRMAYQTKITPPRSGEMNGQWAEFTAQVPAGEHWLSVSLLKMYEGLPQAYKGPKPSSVVGSARIGADAWFPMYLDVVGPYEQVMGPSEESLKKIFPNGRPQGTPDAKSIREIVSNLARQAYRRPVSDEEVDELVKAIAMVQSAGDSFDEGLCIAIQKLLISPYFLYRVERAPNADKSKPIHPIGQHELATRLSYFLWSSMPDEELSRCADEQKLREPGVLEAQVRRMLKDPKAAAIVENFGGQWLLTRALESHVPDRAKFTEFTDYTRMSMKKETDLFFQSIISDDRSVLDFLDGNYTFLNQRLAEFYGIPGVKGQEFRKVDLAGTPRGGVLTQASVLTVSSYANRTSPVLRGKWILDNIVNSPPKPPPADVPNLDESTLGKSVSLREQLEKHRANATCAACHSRMDPLGFALEHFDAIGQWRETDGAAAIDDSGSLPDGRSFKGAAGLREILRADPDAFTDCFADKLLTYALGRGLEPFDRPTVRQITRKSAADNYRFSSVVLGIVESAPFQMQKDAP